MSQMTIPAGRRKGEAPVSLCTRPQSKSALPGALPHTEPSLSCGVLLQMTVNSLEQRELQLPLPLRGF